MRNPTLLNGGRAKVYTLLSIVLAAASGWGIAFWNNSRADANTAMERFGQVATIQNQQNVNTGRIGGLADSQVRTVEAMSRMAQALLDLERRVGILEDTARRRQQRP